jgi:hypothetical protein
MMLYIILSVIVALLLLLIIRKLSYNDFIKHCKEVR